jgi:hypothetical protein
LHTATPENVTYSTPPAYTPPEDTTTIKLGEDNEVEDDFMEDEEILNPFDTTLEDRVASVTQDQPPSPIRSVTASTHRELSFLVDKHSDPRFSSGTTAFLSEDYREEEYLERHFNEPVPVYNENPSESLEIMRASHRENFDGIFATITKKSVQTIDLRTTTTLSHALGVTYPGYAESVITGVSQSEFFVP